MHTADTIANIYSKQISSKLDNLGVMYRIFYRSKSPESLSKKISKNPGKYGDEKKIQDLIGIRVALYFKDDIQTVKDVIHDNFTVDHDSSMIDNHSSDQFKAERHNIICKLPEIHSVSKIIGRKYSSLVDNSMEVQIRTVLSEGWHEVDHDLRYKCQSDWENMEEEARALNGVLATLETSDWTLLKVFDQLAYKNYKSKKIEAMIRTKFRIRISENPIDKNLSLFLLGHPDLLKEIYKFDRRALLKELLARECIPITIDNIIYIINSHSMRNSEIGKLTPDFFLMWWKSIDSS